MEYLFQKPILLVFILMLWVLPWKGYALWTASKLSHKRWFIVLMVFNTFAILDIIYIFYIAKKSPKNFINAFRSKI